LLAGTALCLIGRCWFLPYESDRLRITWKLGGDERVVRGIVLNADGSPACGRVVWVEDDSGGRDDIVKEDGSFRVELGETSVVALHVEDVETVRWTCLKLPAHWGVYFVIKLKDITESRSSWGQIKL